MSTDQHNNEILPPGQMNPDRHKNEILPQTTEETEAERQHNHQVISSPKLGTREWIKQSGHSFGNEPYTVLLEETHQITADIEINIQVIHWNIPQTVK